MNVTGTKLSGVALIVPQIFRDARGYFLETWHDHRYANSRIPGPFVQSNFARSQRGVLRGLHYQLKNPQGKLIWVTRGSVFDVAVDIRLGSPTFGQWIGEVLSEEEHRQLYIPPGFAHGYCVLSDSADFVYLCTDFHVPSDEYGMHWNDRNIAIQWPIASPILSDKDQHHLNLDAIPREQLPVWEHDG